MIVIATHNRIDLLTLMLKRLTEIDLNGHDVLVVDTNSDSAEYRHFMEIHQGWFREMFPKFIFVRKEYTCWDTGAYVHAYRNFRETGFHENKKKVLKYIFLQDSLYIINQNFIKEMDKALDEVDVCPIFNFKYGYDNDDQKRWCEDGLPVTSLPEEGFFGPIFGARASALDKMPFEWFREPSTKNQGCAMERRWALMFHLIGAKKKYFDPIPEGRWMDFWNGHADFKTHISKIWLHRP